MSKEIDAVHSGQAAASCLFDALRESDASMPDDTERLLWWSGFFCTLGGFAAGSLGPDALKAIAKSTADITEKVLSQKSH